MVVAPPLEQQALDTRSAVRQLVGELDARSAVHQLVGELDADAAR